MTIDKSMIKRLVTQTFPDGGDKYFDYEEEFDALCRAIEAAVQAEKQEPVKDELVAWWHYRINGEWDGFSKQNPPEDAYDGGTLTPLYTHPQPDLTAEVEFMQGKYEEMLEEWLPQKQRIAELEEAAREARDALQYKLHVVEAIAKLDAVLGNAEVNGGRLADRPSEAV